MKAFSIKSSSKVFAYSDAISMACGFPRLREIVAAKLRQKPENGDLFLFRNKKANYVKVLYFHNHGFCLLAKRLEQGKFDFSDPKKQMSISDLEKLVNEVVIMGGKRKPHLKVAANS